MLHSSTIARVARFAALAGAGIALDACSPHSRSPAPASAAPVATTSAAKGLVLGEAEGERRMRRPREGGRDATVPVIIKVDGANGGSSQLFMGYEDIPVGEAILPHHHPHADEILFVHRGHGVAMLGDKTA